MSGAICGGGGEWGRCVRRCLVCKARRRRICRLEMGGYGFRAYCGGCGAMNGDGEVVRQGKRDSARARALVAVEWPTARPWRVVVREELDALLTAEALVSGVSA